VSSYLSDAEEILQQEARRGRTLPWYPVVAGALRALRRVLERIDRIEERLLIVDELPESAPFGALIRVRGDLTGALYLGNGLTRPLSKLVPVAL
jgi:hypothetical protein